ncbi:hypothetical protein D0C36_10685 [Mucilaginibacter conchicola]|uniref:Uncharacterized protein n=1 Tax=Mucilaginibacter conchicola TaxID=2303333 RepID=A0A372NTH9_9SPHI|nr:hypothetical protein [Mucilaginibacter conchicola]RFZ91907.1 hypothetical protein D0C36_10685 [Mucilaginibacter conchicola]
MTEQSILFDEVKTIIQILAIVKDKIDDQSEMIYSTWDTPQEAIEEIDDCIKKMLDGDFSILLTLEMFFMVTGPFQELSMQNGWSKEYLKIARQFDAVVLKLKNKIAKLKN